MRRNKVAAGLEIAFAVLITPYALAPLSFWKGAMAVRIFVLLQGAAAVWIARRLRNARDRGWQAVLALGGLGVIELWYASAIFVFSYMGEGLPDHAGYLFLMGCFSIQGIILVIYAIERLALWRRAIRSYGPNCGNGATGAQGREAPRLRGSPTGRKPRKRLRLKPVYMTNSELGGDSAIRQCWRLRLYCLEVPDYTSREHSCWMLFIQGRS